MLPSRAETYGMVVTEALARGIPVLGTQVNGVPEALGAAPDGTVPGLLVPPGDPAALAAALRDWLTDAGLRAALAGRGPGAAGDAAGLGRDDPTTERGARRMTGEFSSTWLTLREPADAAARAAGLVDQLALTPPLVIRDLGCGTGSLGRWLAPLLPGPQHWILQDRDPALLDHAAAHLPDGGRPWRPGSAT